MSKNHFIITRQTTMGEYYGQYFWKFKAANGETICWSEYYHNKQDALDAINLLKKVGPVSDIYESN